MALACDEEPLLEQFDRGLVQVRFGASDATLSAELLGLSQFHGRDVEVKWPSTIARSFG